MPSSTIAFIEEEKLTRQVEPNIFFLPRCTQRLKCLFFLLVQGS